MSTTSVRSIGEAAGRSEFTFSDKDFSTIASILYADAGIVLKPEKAMLVYSRLTKRLRALGLESFAAYCALVSEREGVPERREMLAALTTNVTHFFREEHHFDHLRTRVLPQLLAQARKGGRVRIWSAGCSNGHEPYSIAMTILSLMGNAHELDIRILASDIDPHVVAFGQAGFYDDAALENVPDALRRKFFQRSTSPSGQVMSEVSPQMRALVAFRELNLMGRWPMSRPFDVIFCRNVVIYFDEPSRQTIWNRFRDTLAPGGVLYVGHSERVTGPGSARLSLEATTTYRAKEERA
ncbi:chemotaxis protein [Fulvimarina endophytica]|uniref:Chemotaxis protein methyltransferase n=1 Tax=Fulvimarina endophytica TaxID=2293836 RepID=A0A371X852_9HYPH|nr:protein-glutamate O-methyltransferase [Fulvimarina endophytica]RFC65370.1 chemotaxis protein [Fulvimarina endophytica]